VGCLRLFVHYLNHSGNNPLARDSYIAKASATLLFAPLKEQLRESSIYTLAHSLGLNRPRLC